MSISGMMATSLSALQANQRALNTVSTNVANVNTAGYTRLETTFSSRASAQGAFGVEVDVQRVANKYLIASEMRTAGEYGAAQTIASYMDRLQGLLGDPSSGNSVFSTIDDVYSAFGSLSLDPSSALRQGDVISDLQTTLSRIDQVSQEIAALRAEAHGELVSVMGEANSLMETIADLNTSIQQAKISGIDSTQAENEQTKLLGRLSEIVDIRTQERPLGGIDVRTTSGYLLVSHEAAVFSMGEVSGLQQYPGVEVSSSLMSSKLPIDDFVGGGEMQGLIQARDIDLAEMGVAFGEYAAGLVESINAAHNDATAVPPPNTLSGQNTGLIGTDIHSFSGVTHLAITNANGQYVKNLEINFDTNQITDEGGNVFATGTTIAELQTAIDTALGADGSASFTNGELEISAAATTNGVVVRQNEASPSDWGGQGFAQRFGLNNLIDNATPTNYATGLGGTSPHGFSTGETITLNIKTEDGSVLNTVAITMTAGETVQDIIDDFDAALTGYGQMDLDTNGRLRFVPSGASGATSLDTVTDTTQRVGSNVSLSSMFGLSSVISANRAQGLEIRGDILADYSRLGVAKVDLEGAAPTDVLVGPGDGRGASALSNSGNVTQHFGAVGNMAGQTTSINDFAARLAGVAGAKATSTQLAADSAQSVHDEVALRREGVEGVNIDEELVKMTQYQQAYNAASRMMQAANDMLDTLMQIV